MKASRTKLYVSLLLTFALLSLFSLNSCSNDENESESESTTPITESSESESEKETESESDSDSSTAEELTYSAPSYEAPEPTESATSTQDETESLSETESQSETESNSDTVSETESVSENESESESESDSEQETPTIELPADKLEYLSNGNGTCTLISAGESTDTCIIIPNKSPDGDVVTSIGEKAFFNCDFLSAVQIPSTVTSIGHLAFADCDSLVYISVSEGNPAFRDVLGTLFSIDGKTLLQYPCASNALSFDIPISVEEICDMAFYKCNSLRIINYEGKMEDWGQIDIGSMNFALFSAYVNCVK